MNANDIPDEVITKIAEGKIQTIAGMTVKTIDGILTTAFECYDGCLGFEEDKAPEFKNEKIFLGNFITGKYKAPKNTYRGLHMSAVNEDFICPVWVGMGWADAGHEFCKKLLKEFKLEDKVTLNPRKNDWVKKDTGQKHEKGQVSCKKI